MDALRHELKSRCLSLLVGDLPPQEFEAWVYSTPELEEILGREDYLFFLELDYSSRMTEVEIGGWGNRFFDSSFSTEWQTLKQKKKDEAILQDMTEWEWTEYDNVYRKIAVWRSRTKMFLFALIFSFPLLAILLFPFASVVAALFQWDEVDCMIAILYIILALHIFFVIVPYVVCVIRLCELMKSATGCLILSASVPVLFPLFVLFSLCLLFDSWRMLRKAGYTVGFFRTDWKQFSKPLT